MRLMLLIICYLCIFFYISESPKEYLNLECNGRCLQRLTDYNCTLHAAQVDFPWGQIHSASSRMPGLRFKCFTDCMTLFDINLTPQGLTPFLPSKSGGAKVSGGGTKPGKVQPSTSWSEHCQLVPVTKPSSVEARIPSWAPRSSHSIAKT